MADVAAPILPATSRFSKAARPILAMAQHVLSAKQAATPRSEAGPSPLLCTAFPATPATQDGADLLKELERQQQKAQAWKVGPELRVRV